MAWKYDVEAFAEGDLTTPNELNQEFQELASEMNGFLDRDNFPPGWVTENRIVIDSINNVEFADLTASAHVEFVREAGNSGLAWRTIPGLDVSIDCVDGSLFVEAGIAVRTGVPRLTDEEDEGNHPTPSADSRVMFGILVDGVLVAQSDYEDCQDNDFDGNPKNSFHLVANIPIAAGPRTVQAVLRNMDTNPTAGFQETDIIVDFGMNSAINKRR